MRLIDADAFKKYIRDACNEMSHVYKDGGKWAKQITEDFCMDIDEQPTIEERKTGKWIYTPTEPLGYICSECKKGCCRYNYCPNCRADMRSENDDIPIEYFESGGK